MTATGGHSGAIATDFVDFDWSVISAYDPATGLITGNRQHKPLVLTMRADATSVSLLDEMFHNGNINPFQLAFVHQGETSTYMTIALKNAHVVSVHQFTEGGEEYDEVSFVYQTITITWVGGPVTTDDWVASVN